MTKFISTYTLVFIFAMMPYMMFCQYTENFDIADRGAITVHTPSFSTDLTGVNWSVALGTFIGTLSGSTNYAKTIAGALEFRNTDRDVCFTTPVLDISSPATSSFSIPFEAIDIEFQDFLQVSYQVNGGAWVDLANQFGGGAETVGRLSTAQGDWDATGTITASGITGNTLTVRICGNTTSSLDILKVFSVSVPEAGTIVLPVKWGSVSVDKSADGNTLKWTTYNEVNNESFEVERSLDGGDNFTVVGTLNGAGNSSQLNEYKFVDNHDFPSTAIVYYRVKQTDYDGKFDYSPIVALRNEKRNNYYVSPNPFHNFLTITADEYSENEVIFINDSFGRKIRAFNSLNGTVDTSDLLPGIYIIQFPSEEVVKLVKF